MSYSTVDDWEPVTDEVAESSEMTLTYRKGNVIHEVEKNTNTNETEEINRDCTLEDETNGKPSIRAIDGPAQEFEEITKTEDEDTDSLCEVDGFQEDYIKKNPRMDSSNKSETLCSTDSEYSKAANTRRQSHMDSISSNKSPRHRKSSSSLDVNVPLNLKSSPADPHLSDVNSISSAEKLPPKKFAAINSVNNIISSTDIDGSQTAIPASNSETLQQNGATPSFFDNMISSLSFKSSGTSTVSATNKVAHSTNGKASNPPDIITHRRQTSLDNKKIVSRKDGSSSNPGSPLQQVEKPKELSRRTLSGDGQEFDPKRFVNEKYLDTPFHFASEDRNAEFHNLFNTIPKNDRLLDDFSCTLSREFLYQGRIYVSEGNLCFQSSLLGWIAKVIVPFRDITYMEKTSTAGLFPNAISVETENGKTQFNGFISRDAAFTLIKEIWSRTLLELGESGNLKPISSETSGDNRYSLTESAVNNMGVNGMTRPCDPPSRDSFISENDSIIEDAIRSVDDYTPDYSKYEVFSEDDEIENVDEQKDLKVKAYKLKSNSKYDYDGPYYYKETDLPSEPNDNNEYVLAEFECKAPPGLVFQILFSDDNPSFWFDFFPSQDSSNISDIGKFDQADEEGHLFRDFSYAKGLHFPVGPKSTKCLVNETIQHLDYTGYIDVVNTTRTPDVPSGGSFSTKTRYRFRWGSATTCILRVSFYVKWTAGSWIKSMVESSCKNGQISATKDLVKLIQKYVSANTEETEINVPSSKKSPSKSKTVTKSSKISQRKIASDNTPAAVETLSPEIKPISFTQIHLIIFLLLIIILLLLWNLSYLSSLTRDINEIKSSPFIKMTAPEHKNFCTLARSLVDIPAKVGGDRTKNTHLPKIWAALQNKLIPNLPDDTVHEDLLKDASRERLMAIIETLLSEASPHQD